MQNTFGKEIIKYGIDRCLMWPFLWLDIPIADPNVIIMKIFHSSVEDMS